MSVLEGSTAKKKFLGLSKPRKASLIKAPKKWPMAIPARTSEGKCFLDSNRAQPVVKERARKPALKPVRAPSGISRYWRLRVARVLQTVVLEACPEGKLS
jgi:hypothetical protein